MTTGIIVALPEELKTLCKEKLSPGEVRYISSEILVCLAGTGPENATISARNLIDYGVSRLISWGCAAALDPDLDSGDLVLASEITSGTNSYTSDPQWLEKIIQTITLPGKFVTGTIISSDRLIETIEDKSKIFLDTKACALDMESFAIALTAHQRSIPFVAIRSIADPANFALPKVISSSMNDKGVVEIKPLLFQLLKNPGQIPALIHLGLCFFSAQKTLKLVANSLNKFTNS